MYTNIEFHREKFFNKFSFTLNNTSFLLQLNKDYSYSLDEGINRCSGKFALTMLRTDVFIAELDNKLRALLDLTNKKITLLDFLNNNCLPIAEYSNE
jgi:hypothetical protein